ncbi:MAG: putative Uroporphyrinogen-III decarboxylase-like [Promethearchaeota archaeon]|nr:MAG: putative Uroporphyrinogen-III decarboxylase-like [Candidatus Lokiarchaeota archaeon]
MRIANDLFMDALKKKKPKNKNFPLYCTGYPEVEFLNAYIKSYNINPDPDDSYILNGKDFSLIKKMKFDAVSLWDFRRGKGGYTIDGEKNLKVDGWGRIMKDEWYTWDGVLKNEKILRDWDHLNLPKDSEFQKLKLFLEDMKEQLTFVLSLPGLFEKTWQSIGFISFSKLLKSQNFEFLKSLISFFSDYIKSLVRSLREVGAYIFLIADDLGYKKRLFIPKEIWKKLFYDKYKEIIQLIHQKRDHKVIIHSDGYIMNMIDLFINLKFDGVQGLEPTAGVDIHSLFRKFKDRICFIGNLDVSSILSFGEPSQVKEYILKLINNAKLNGSPLVVSPTQQILSSVKIENIKAMIDITKGF